MEDTRVLVEEESTTEPSEEQEILARQIDEKFPEKQTSSTEDHQGPKPKKESKKGKKKTKGEKTSTAVAADHGENEEEDKADLGDMGTLFILDLMRQKREKLMRQKKDEKINEMAMKKVRPNQIKCIIVACNRLSKTYYIFMF